MKLALLGYLLLAQTPVRTAFIQVHPATNEGALLHTPGQSRALILIHGCCLKTDNARILLPCLHDWQKPGSVTVKRFGEIADVFAFTYSQEVSVEQASQAPLLREKIAELRQAGYRDVVLLGHSAGGLLARLLVEDHPDCGVTEVIQVCTPNAGCTLARLAPVAVPSQQPFLQSLSPAARRAALLHRRDKTIPSGIRFCCIVGHGAGDGDGLLTCDQQWSSDLRTQGIRALPLPARHEDALTDPRHVQAICDAVGSGQRLQPHEVRLLEQRLLPSIRFP